MNLPGPSHEASEAVLVDVLDELTARINAGESFDLAEYEQRFPEHIEQIRKLAATLEAMAQFSRSPPSAEKPESAPRRLGDFHIIRELGRGGMGIVYEAEQVSLGRPVALKVLPYAALMDERAIQRFRNEARAAALLDHPHIVPVHAVSAERGVHFYAMSLIHGLTLAEVIAEMRSRIKSTDQADLSVLQIVSDNSGRPDEESQSKASGYEPTLDHSTKSGEDEQQPADFVLDIPDQLDTRREVQAAISTHRGDFDTEYFRRATRIGVEAAEALDHAHQHGILHRDVKPGNLMIDGSGKTWITDFGLARIGTDAGMTATGDLIGTVRYMAPEQALAKRVTIDHRADIYSLGVTLYELLTLQPAFDAPDREAMLKQIAFEEPRLPRRINPVIPRELEVIVLKALAKHPNDRFETAQELADDLRRFLDDEPIRAKPPTLAQRATRFARRHKPLVTSAVIILLLTTVGLAVGNVLIAQQRNRAEEASAEAKKQTEIAQQNFQRARDAVDQYLTKVSDDELLNTPGMQPLREDLLNLALKYSNTLGIAHYRNGQWEEAIAALTKSMELADGGGDASDFFFLAMAHWQRGDEEEANQWYQKGATWTWNHVPDQTMLRYGNEAAELLRRPPPPVCEVLLLPHEPLFSHRPFFDAEHLLKLLHAQSRLGPDDTFHQELALAGFRSQLRIVDPEWALGRIVMLPKAVSAHYNPRDGRLYVGRRRPEGNEPDGQWKFLGGLCCIAADGSAQEILATDRIGGVAVDHGTGDVYFTEDRLGKIRRIAFGKTQPEDWVSHFPQGNTFPVGLAIADADSLPGQGFVVNHGALHQRDELHRFSTIDPEDVVAFHSDAPDDGPLAAPLDVAIRNDEVFVADPTMGIFQLEAEGSLQPVELRERLKPKGIAVDPATGNLVVVDAAKRRLVTVNTITGEVTTLATGLVCHYWGSAGIDVTPDGKQLFYTEYDSGLIVTLTRETGGNSPFEEGLAHAERHEWDRAASRFTETTEQNPTCAVAYSERGFAYAELKKLDLAASDWVTAETIDPAVSLHHCYRGEVFREEGQLIRALAEYDKALQLDPELAQAHAGRGCVRLEQQEIGEAIASLTRAIELDPLHAISYAERGFAFQIKQELDKANDDWKMAQQLKDDCSAHFLRQGEVRAAMSRWEQAAISYSKAIQFDPANHRLYAKRAAAWTRCEHWAKAEQDLLKVIELGPPAAKPWHAIGVVRLAQGNVEAYRRGCSELFERYSDAEPLAIRHWRLAWCCEPYPPTEDVLQQALLYAERAKPIPANVERAKGVFSSLLLWAGRFEEKAKTIEEDFVWAPGSEWKGLRLAIYHAKAGRPEEAHRYLERTKPLVEEGVKTRRRSTYVELQLQLLMRMAEKLIEQQDGKLETTE